MKEHSVMVDNLQGTRKVDVVVKARLLRSEDGENPEYDRALVELSEDILGLPRESLGETILGRKRATRMYPGRR